MKPVEVTYHETDIAIVTLLGEHDLSTRDELERVFRQLVRSGEQIIVDLSRVEFIDSSVLRNLLIATSQGHERGLSVTLQLSTEPRVRRVLQVTGLLDRLPCAVTREEAIGLARNCTEALNPPVA